MGALLHRIYAQEYAKPSRAENAESCAMTEGDLGLPLGQWTVDWLNDHYTFAVLPAPPLYVRRSPFFWLGAQAEVA
jgi:hypothetical protein